MRIMGLSLVAMFAVAAVFAGAASAKTVLTLKTAKGALAPGAELKAESSNLVFVTSSGNLECTSNILEGTVENNGAAKDKGSVTKESSTGEEAGGLCKTTTGLGPASIESSGFPWPIEYTTKGTSSLKGSKKVTFTSTFPGAGGAKCTYEAAKVASTFNTSGVITQTTTNQVFKANKKTSNPACPKEGKLSGSFKLFSGDEAVEAEL
jgi:hypothetical protein